MLYITDYTAMFSTSFPRSIPPVQDRWDHTTEHIHAGGWWINIFNSRCGTIQLNTSTYCAACCFIPQDSSDSSDHCALNEGSSPRRPGNARQPGGLQHG